MSTLKNKLLYPIIAFVIGGIVLFWIKGGDTILRDITIGEDTSSSNPSDLIQKLWTDQVLVEGGTFQMGCTSEQVDCYDDEKPVHEVTVSSYKIGKYEVTQAQWVAIMGSNPSYYEDCGGDCPVEVVSWDTAQVFIRKLNDLTGKKFRLPRESEWEFAARGGNKSKGFQYAGSNNINDVAWYKDNRKAKTHPVGLKKANELGLYDMSGNVYEWCEDWHGEYPSSLSVDSQRAFPEMERIVRGGACDLKPRDCRVANRYSGQSISRFYRFGLRLASSL